ncbi:MAG TPA: hypothetical protein VNN77_12300 [candidate division Zixibacteria bacterium]|nr:hypothetical protein [candidate division Zixibacteria bacterium]
MSGDKAILIRNLDKGPEVRHGRSGGVSPPLNNGTRATAGGKSEPSGITSSFDANRPEPAVNTFFPILD